MLPKLVIEGLNLNLRRLRQFTVSFLLDVTASLAYAGITVIFWRVIYGRIRPLPGWTLGQAFAFSAFFELFYALSMSLFVGTGKLWNNIITGRIDVYLIRPVDPRLLMGLLTVRMESFIRALPSIVLLFSLALAHGVRFTIGNALASLVIVTLGALTYAFVQMAGSWASFWIGRAQMLDEITDSLNELARYPHTIFPDWLRMALMTVVPMAFASTEPARVLTGMSGNMVGAIGVAMGVTAVWWFIQDLLWKKGLRRYDSYGG